MINNQQHKVKIAHRGISNFEHTISSHNDEPFPILNLSKIAKVEKNESIDEINQSVKKLREDRYKDYSQRINKMRQRLCQHNDSSDQIIAMNNIRFRRIISPNSKIAISKMSNFQIGAEVRNKINNTTCDDTKGSRSYMN